jgi:hypothetical protein
MKTLPRAFAPGFLDGVSAPGKFGAGYGTQTDVMQHPTEYDSFPYRRWFRGVPGSAEPLVHPRVAGWRLRQDAMYAPTQTRTQINAYDLYPSHCFEAACSTRLPSRRDDRKMDCACGARAVGSRGLIPGQHFSLAGSGSSASYGGYGGNGNGDGRGGRGGGTSVGPRETWRSTTFGTDACGSCGGCGDANIFYAPSHSTVVMPP